jgi:uncharacterized protein involved in outer membrane biogenesis
MRKVLAIVGVVVALLFIALLVIPAFVNVNQYHDRIQAELQSRLGRQVTLGKMRLRLLPPKFRVENVVVADDPAFSTARPFARAAQLDVAVKLLPLLRKDVEISSLTLNRPTIELIKNARGAWNFSSIGKAPAPVTAAPQQRPAQPQQAPPPANAGQQNFALDKLVINDGLVALTDVQKRQTRSVYDHIDLTLKDFAPDKPFSLDAAVHLPGAGKQTLTLVGDGGPINSGAPALTPFRGTLKMNEVSLAAAQRFLSSPALQGTDAVITGRMDLNNQAGKVASIGSVKLTQVRLKGSEVGYPIEADYDLNDDLNRDLIQIARGSLKLGGTPLSVTGSLNAALTPAQADLRIKASNVSLAEASRLAAAMGTGLTPGTTVNGNLTADVHVQGAVSQPAMSGTISAKNLAVTGKDLPQAVNIPAIDLALSPTQIQSNDFTAKTGGTNLAIRFAFAGYTTASPNINATVRTANASIAEILNMAKAYSPAAADMNGSGSINLDLRAQGPAKNASQLALNGTGQIRNAALKTATMTQPLFVPEANLAFTQNSVNIQNLAAHLGQTHASGTMSVSNFAAPRLQFDLSADKINVAELQQITSGPGSPAAKQKQAQSFSLVPAAQAAAPPQPGLLQKATGGGTLSVGTVVNDQLVLNNVRSNVALDHGVMRLAPLTAELYGGQENGTIVVDTRRTPLGVAVTSNLQRVDANKLLSAVSPLKQTLFGVLAANSNISFNAANSNDIARTLNGKLSLNLANGRLAGIDLLHEIASVGKFLGGAAGAPKGFTEIAGLTGDFNVVNGLAQTNNLKATLGTGSLAGDGGVNLAAQTLNMRLTAVLSKSFSRQVGGSSIGGFMNTALQNSQGELVVPLIVTGSFQHPSFTPDLQKIAQMRLKNALPTAGNPAGAAAGILGGLLGQRNKAQQQPAAGQPQSPQQQQQQNPNDAVQGLLNQVLGGKKKPQQQQPPR